MAEMIATESPSVLGMAAIMQKERGQCVHLGITVPNTKGGCRTTHECDNGHGLVRPCVECKTCKDFKGEGE